MSGFDDLTAWLQAMPSTSDLKWELERLHAIRKWAMEHLDVDYEVGDRVEFVSAPDTDNGWAPYRDCLVVGATAVVKNIDFNPFHGGHWYAEIVLDREFSVADPKFADGCTHYWNGPADQTPDGMKPPSKFDQDNHPDGRKHTFHIGVQRFRKVRATVNLCATCPALEETAEEIASDT